jgi:hypothetical protein
LTALLATLATLTALLATWIILLSHVFLQMLLRYVQCGVTRPDTVRSNLQFRSVFVGQRKGPAFGGA